MEKQIFETINQNNKEELTPQMISELNKAEETAKEILNYANEVKEVKKDVSKKKLAYILDLYMSACGGALSITGALTFAGVVINTNMKEGFEAAQNVVEVIEKNPTITVPMIITSIIAVIGTLKRPYSANKLIEAQEKLKDLTRLG